MSVNHQADAEGWAYGDQIVIATTSYNVWETETNFVETIAEDKRTLILREALKYKHIGKTD